MDTGLFYFGIVDNGALCLACLGGWSIDRYASRWLPKRWHSPAATMAAAALVGNTVSDALAAVPMGWRAVVAVAAGCIVGPLLAAVAVGAWRLVSNGLGLAGNGCRRVDTALDASEG
jgi:hypothetical protein